MKKMRFCGIIFLFLCSMNLQCLAGEIYQGLDVSVYQGDINFEQVKASGYDCVYIRAGSGESGEDRLFMEHYQKAKDEGLNVGFYYYVTAESVEEGEAQAEEFESLISKSEYQLRPAMDYESFSQVTVEESVEIAQSFLKKLEEILNVRPVIYSDASNVNNRWGSELMQYPLWVADYADLTDPTSYQLGGKSGWKEWSGYQYTDLLEVPGISGNVDGDIFKDSMFIDKSTSSTLFYEVKLGDTLWKIGKNYGVTIEQLVGLNDITNENLIYVGETLKIPTNDVYFVKSGDTLSEIARVFDTTISQLATSNNIKDINLIYVGQQLHISN